MRSSQLKTDLGLERPPGSRCVTAETTFLGCADSEREEVPFNWWGAGVSFIVEWPLRNRSFGAVDFKPARSAARAGCLYQGPTRSLGAFQRISRDHVTAGRTGDLLAWWSKPDISGTCESGTATIQSHLDDGTSGACREAPTKVTGGGRDFVQESCRFGGVIGDGGYARVFA